MLRMSTLRAPPRAREPIMTARRSSTVRRAMSCGVPSSYTWKLMMSQWFDEQGNHH